jgi:hypothetical protein
VLVPGEAFYLTDVAVERKPLLHPPCTGMAVFDIVHYVNLEQWPGFRELLTDERLAEVRCDRCDITASVHYSFITDIPQRNLLILATHHGDGDGTVTQIFNRTMSIAETFLAPEVVQRARSRPYTVVHGIRGLRVLLDALDGAPIPEPSKPFAHIPDPVRGFESLHGYKYGDLFFFYAGQRTVDDLVNTYLHWSTTVHDAADMENAIRVGEGMLDILGNHHPWLLQEVGRMHLELGDVVAAVPYLEAARRAGNAWLAVTASVLDATPTKRADGEPQSAELPHALPASVLSDVTMTRHTLIRQRPADRDYGFWHFPVMERREYPDGYSNVKTFAAHGLALGSFCRFFVDERLLGTDVFFLSLNDLFGQTMDLLRSLPEGEFAEEVHGFWLHYVRNRWLSGAGEPKFRDLRELLRAITRIKPADDVSGFYLTGSIEFLRSSL